MLASGCVGGGDLLPVVVRDSAGVLVVESRQGGWAGREVWRVDPEPLLDLGGAEDHPAREFHDVSGVHRFADGRLVVADGGTRELRFFDAEGRSLGTSGGEGSAPGEFRLVSSIHPLAGDSLLVWDGRLRRASVLDEGGAFVRSFRLDPAGHELDVPRAVLPDGTLLVSSSVPMGTRRTTGVQRDTALFLRFDLEGVAAGRIGAFPGGERYVRVTGELRSTVARPFGRFTSVAAAEDGFYLGTGDAYEIAFRRPAGELRRIVRLDRPNEPVTPEDVERYQERRLAELPAGFPATARRAVEEAPYPETMPAYRELRTDPGGHLWVEEFPRPGEDASTWTVFDPDGVLLGSLRLPEGFRLHQIGGDFLLGVHHDDLGVERIRMYRLRRDE